MAIMTVRSTYALDPDTVRRLDEVARRWGVSKSEALRRAIRAVAGQSAGSRRGPTEALDALQRSLGLSGGPARSWARQMRQERRALRRERRR